MNNEQKFLICKHCGNMVGKISDSGVPIYCCGEPMTEVTANTAEASKEKHLPVVKITDKGITVEVGSALHPMTQAHHIDFVYVQTVGGGQRKRLDPEGAPVATFAFDGDSPVAVFAYCNLHGLWKTNL